MAGKQTEEMRKALRLVSRGARVKDAAEKAGVHWTSVYQSIAKERETIVSRSTAKNPRIPATDAVAAAILKRHGAG